MKFFRIVGKALVAIFTPLLINQASAGTNNYFAIPPFLISEIKPNVLIILDNSGSMKAPAYWPQDLPFNKVDDKSFDPKKTYSGIFNPKSRYRYLKDKGTFVVDENGEWSGNFLNWLTTRRYDVLLKVLVGGNIKKTQSEIYIQGLNIANKDPSDYKFKKKCPSKEICQNALPKEFIGKKIIVGIDCDGDPNTKLDRYCFKIQLDDQQDKSFRKKGKRKKKKPKKFFIKLKLSEEPTGIIQTYLNKVRMGLMVFNKGNKYEGAEENETIGNDGGKVISYVSDNNTKILDFFKNIDSNSKYVLYPHTWTPLAETYYEAIRYFEARKSAYNENINYSDNDPIKVWCQQNYVILITDGESTKDKNLPGTYFEGTEEPVSDPNFDIKELMDEIAENEGTESFYTKERSSDGTYYLEGAAYYAHKTDLRQDLPGKQNINLFVIYTFGKSGSNLLKFSAKYGGFTDINGNDKPDIQSEWDRNGDGIPDNYFEASDESKLRKTLNHIFLQILSKASSGSAVSIPMKNQRHDYLALQAIFNPQKNFEENYVNWIGDIYTWWLFSNKKVSNIREDTNQNYTLDILEDYILEWAFKDNKLTIKAFKSDENGNKRTECLDCELDYSSLDETHPIFRIGEQLLYTPASDRKIYTTLDGKSLIEFKDDNASKFLVETSYENNVLKIPLLGVPADCFNYCDFLEKCANKCGTDGTCIGFCTINKFFECVANKSDYYEKLINWIRGTDYPEFRSRTTSKPVTDNKGSDENVWKLGDVIYSSPVSVNYGDYTVTFVGANDGMLHAFRVGYTKHTWNKQSPVKIQNSKSDNGTYGLGEEIWAYIPQNVLPYLAFLSDPDYRHIYTVDLRPYVVKIKDGDKQRVILIGGLRLGGATESTDSSAINPPDYACPASIFSEIKKFCKSCISLGFPMASSFCDIIPDYKDYNACIGLSSYFALDVTDPEKPKLLWEFPSKDLSGATLGINYSLKNFHLNFSYSGPAVIKDKDNYYVVFATGPINYSATYLDSYNKDDTVKLVLLDLNTGNILRIISVFKSDKPDFSPPSSFSGRLFTTGLDLNQDGNTDYVIFGFTKKEDSRKFSGGVAVLAGKIENDKLYPLSSQPIENWEVKTITQLGNIQIPPITAKVEAMQCFGNWYIYFGTGRWFSKKDNSEISDNYLVGVPLIPYTSNGNISNFRDFDYITLPTKYVDVSDESKAKTICNDTTGNNLDGWYLKLNGEEGSFLREKNISDPTPTKQNIIIFTTTQPNGDVCQFGGRSRVWRLNCALGTAIDYSCPGGVNSPFKLSKEPKGTLFLQLSNGNIITVNLASDFTKNQNRTTEWFEGIAPETATPLITSVGLQGELLLWLEK